MVVVASWAVTVIVTVLAPTARPVTAWPAPLATVVPLTVIVAEAWPAVGVTVTWVTEFATPAAYAVVEAENAGLMVPGLTARLVRSASSEAGAARVTVTV